jgi:hypothetical protein
MAAARGAHRCHAGAGVRADGADDGAVGGNAEELLVSAVAPAVVVTKTSIDGMRGHLAT